MPYLCSRPLCLPFAISLRRIRAGDCEKRARAMRCSRDCSVVNQLENVHQPYTCFGWMAANQQSYTYRTESCYSISKCFGWMVYVSSFQETFRSIYTRGMSAGEAFAEGHHPVLMGRGLTSTTQNGTAAAWIPSPRSYVQSDGRLTMYQVPHLLASESPEPENLSPGLKISAKT